MNLYAFAGNNPIAFSDPFGLCPSDDRGATSGAESGGSGDSSQSAKSRGDSSYWSNVNCDGKDDDGHRQLEGDFHSGDNGSNHHVIETATGKGTFEVFEAGNDATGVHDNYLPFGPYAAPFVNKHGHSGAGGGRQEERKHSASDPDFIHASELGLQLQDQCRSAKKGP